MNTTRNRNNCSIRVLGVVFMMALAVGFSVSCFSEKSNNILQQKGGGLDIQLGVSMMLWYGYEPGTGRSVGGLGSEHWQSGVISNTGFHDPVAVTPELGYYASDDREVIASQVKLMQDVGITWISTGWWGWGDDDLDGDIENAGRMAVDRANHVLFEYLESLDGEVKATIGMDNWMIPVEQWGIDAPVFVDQADSQLIWDHIYQNFVERYPDVYFKVDGKPLVTSFAPHVLRPDEFGRFTYKKLWPLTFGDPRSAQMDWSWVDPMVDPDDYQTSILSEDGFITISPRFDQYWGWLLGYVDGEPMRKDPFLEEGRYDDNWEAVYQIRERVSLVHIATWNDYHEQTQIEPSSNGSLGSENLLSKTGYYWNIVKNDLPFVLR